MDGIRASVFPALLPQECTATPKRQRAGFANATAATRRMREQLGAWERETAIDRAWSAAMMQG